MSRLVVLVGAVALGLFAGGCGDRATPESHGRQEDSVSRPADDSTHHQGVRVLFDEPWVVEEGVWFIAAEDEYPAHPDRAVKGQANGLLGAGGRGALVVNVPALYGKFATRIELHDEEPAVPGWCEDVVEVSYRVRYCADGLDTVAAETAEDEFDGDDYRLYTGRHLLQFWPGAPRPDLVVREGSKFAASQAPG